MQRDQNVMMLNVGAVGGLFFLLCGLVEGACVISESGPSLGAPGTIEIAQELVEDCFADVDWRTQTEEQTFQASSSRSILGFGFVTLAADLSEDFGGSLHRVAPDGVIGEEVASGVFDPNLGIQELIAWAFLPFDTPYQPAANERLAIRISTGTIYFSDSDSYADGFLVSDPGKDMAFRIYTIPEPEFGALGLSVVIFSAMLRLRPQRPGRA